ncbi:MAG: hypothetical protein U1E36_05440 [Rickettsiales bacterium]
MDSYIPDQKPDRTLIVLGTSQDAKIIKQYFEEFKVKHFEHPEAAAACLKQGDVEGIVVRDNMDFVDQVISGHVVDDPNVMLTPILQHSVAGILNRGTAHTAEALGLVMHPTADWFSEHQPKDTLPAKGIGEHVKRARKAIGEAIRQPFASSASAMFKPEDLTRFKNLISETAAIGRHTVYQARNPVITPDAVDYNSL